MDMLGFLLVTVSCNVTILGKIWLLVSVLLRPAAVVLAGWPVYQDEQERFVCNTLQPGCANVCYDAFAPVSPLRFWLLHSLLVLLPPAVFLLWVLHRAARLCACAAGPARLGGVVEGGAGDRGGARVPAVPDFSRGYAAQLCARSLAEAGLGAWQYVHVGLAVPARVACSRAPCSGAVDCFVSRPTEKALLALGLWAISALSLLLSLADLLCSLRRAGGCRPGTPAAQGRGAEPPGEHGSGVLSSASHGGPGRSPPREARDPQRGGHAGTEEPRLTPCSQLAWQPPGSSGGAPHLRAKKSEWV
ncbi:gap junction delta-4 protein [Erinaceus europaeus]|uniref:Gap junction protein n=1 Tax=Erinaceus europaeus TaxID=9365 RepID=A0A1S2ZSY7_ERIEU|nr:gap junction delta-4 protein [Erinaceus europaeus]